MTREELKAHCERQVEACEVWARYKGEEPHGKVYEEHKLILELLEQEPRWIPTSVRAPEKNGSYLVQYCSFDGTARIKFMTVDHYSVGESWLHEEKNRKVEAWMPLPELYKGSKVGWSSLENIREKVEKEPE